MMLEQLKKMVPLPDLLSFQTYLFVGPHPDDIEISSGGLVSKLVSLGKTVDFLVITDGGAGSMNPDQDINKLVSTRLEEAKKSAEFLGVKELYNLGYPDGGLYHEHEVSIQIAKVILDINPDVLICPDPHQSAEIHPDHIKAGLATNQAVLLSNFPLMAKRNLIEYAKEQLKHFRPRVLAYYFTDRPNSFISLEDENIQQRYLSISKHVSQFPTKDSLDMIAQYLGVRSMIFQEEHGVANAEGYFVMDSIHQHCFPEILKY